MTLKVKKFDYEDEEPYYEYEMPICECMVKGYPFLWEWVDEKEGRPRLMIMSMDHNDGDPGYDFELKFCPNCGKKIEIELEVHSYKKKRKVMEVKTDEWEEEE